MLKVLAPYFYPAEETSWEDFELVMCKLKERTVGLLQLPDWEAQKRKHNREEEHKLINISVIKHIVI
jgi:hypothetical protein